METKEARYDAAVALKDEDKIAEAIAAMEQLCVDFPDYALPHAALSMWYRRREDFEKSLEHASRVCELEPEDPFSFTALSVRALHSGNHELAEEALQKPLLRPKLLGQTPKPPTWVTPQRKPRTTLRRPRVTPRRTLRSKSPSKGGANFQRNAERKPEETRSYFRAKGERT